MNTNAAKATLTNGVLDVSGTGNDDRFVISRQGQALTVTFNGQTLGTFSNKLVDSVRVSGFVGDDTLAVARDV